MKGLFVLQRRFAYIGHEIAKNLRAQGVADEFCGYVQLRDSYRFLKLQKELDYTGLLLDEDVQKRYKVEPLDKAFLAKLEAKYGPLSRYINVDRVVAHGQLLREYPHDKSPYTKNEQLRLVQVFAKAVEDFLDTERPDFVYGYIFGSMGTLLLYDMAKKRGIPVITSIVPSTRNLVTFTERYDRLTYVERLVQESKDKPLVEISGYQNARTFLEEFRNKPFVYTQVVLERENSNTWGQFAFLKPKNFFWSLYYNSVRIFIDWFRDSERRSDYTTVNPFLHIYDRLKRKMRNLRGLEDLYDDFDTSKKYAFFPLQYEPEMSLLLLAPEATDQLAVVERIAHALPDGMRLYVKEHPGMMSFRPRRYYRALKKIPNVRLVDPAIKGFDLIRHAKLVTVINGTPGWEAALLGKPVITFGDIFYNALSFVGHSRAPDELPALIQKQLHVKTEDGELLRFLAALFEDSATLDLMYLWEVETDQEKKRIGLKSFADVLAKKISALAKRS